MSSPLDPAPIALAAALASCGIPDAPPVPPAEDPDEEPPPYDSAPGLQRTPRGERLSPPRLDQPVLVRWRGGVEARLPISTALRRARALGLPATLEGPGFRGTIEAGGTGWTIQRA